MMGTESFQFSTCLFDFQKVINQLISATDAKKVDEIIRQFLGSISVLYFKRDIMHKMFSYIHIELADCDIQNAKKFERALFLIGNHKYFTDKLSIRQML